MPVAVHLVEALALVTLMGMITCVSLGVVVAHQTLNLTILFIEVVKMSTRLVKTSALIPFFLSQPRTYST